MCVCCCTPECGGKGSSHVKCWDHFFSPYSLVRHLVQQVRARHERRRAGGEARIRNVSVHQGDASADLLLSVVVVSHGNHVGGEVHADHPSSFGHALCQDAGAGAHPTAEVDDDSTLFDLPSDSFFTYVGEATHRVATLLRRERV